MEYMAQKMKPATYNLRLVYLKAFFKWCIGEGYLQKNPLDGLKRRKAEPRIVDIDTEILQKLLHLPHKSTFAGLRDYGLLLITLDTGLRPKEACSLLINDINFRTLEITVRAEVSKTGSTRTLPILPITAKAIKDLINARHPAWKENIPVFCSSEGTFFTKDSWRSRLDMYSKILGTHIRPYDLRHTFAVMYLRNGGLELGLQRTLGHTTLFMTKTYVHFTNKDMHDMNNIASPLNNLLPQKNRVRKIRRP
ncbi:MAG: tyrosine-type recombinase/integrase [Tepidanaerobacteraceae bacterium]|jgi:integrase|nr:tyrosine-type recombinase/integrase [Tepidanaerobacteraceae bacterium]